MFHLKNKLKAQSYKVNFSYQFSALGFQPRMHQNLLNQNWQCLMNSFPIYTPNYPKKIREFVPKKLAAKKNRRFDHIVGMDFNPSYFENI
ncbi:hypothetical protein BXU11_01295 [Flavobacterium sp. LM5]|nr:hypothetical protein BXU11_01295 [Flavobacterium sp. LM5]